ncbi:MAG: oligosaccharide flippase family protein [Actinomycetota bacterium]|nr:oligosaccharide flippase family protein [Actinomycetota bacterium]
MPQRRSPAPSGSGFTSLAAGRVGAAILSWVWLLLVARILPVDDFGVLALLLAIGSIVSVVADLGLPLVLMQEASQRPGAVWTALVITTRKRLVAGVVASGLVVAAFSVSAPGRGLAFPAVYSVSIIATTVYTSVAAALRAIGSARVEAANELASRLFVLVVGGTMLVSGRGLLAAVAAYAMADLGSALLLWKVAHRQLAHRREDVDGNRFAIPRTAPLAAGGILGTLYNRVDIWLLALMASNTSVAIYAAAYRILDGLLLPSSALSSLVVPRTAKMSVTGRKPVVGRLIRRSLLLLAPVAFGIALLSGPILQTAFGADYAASAPVLATLMLSALPGAAIFVLAPIAALADRFAFLRAVVVALVVNVGANVVLIPAHGVVGAALATVLSQTILWWALARVANGRGSDNITPSRSHSVSHA